MTRAALLPAGSDPFLIAYWLRHYRTWAEHVNELHVAVCGPIPGEVQEYLSRAVRAVPNAKMHRFPQRTDHGRVLEALFAQSTADVVVMVEDDAFVRRPEEIAHCFGLIESGQTDIVGCPRDGYGSPDILGIARSKFGDGPLAFWPCFLFARRADLEATDRDFSGTNWKAGDDFLGTPLPNPGSIDTFIWASLQLRAMGLRAELRPGNRLGSNVERDAAWFHVGSLSQGHGNMWQNPRMTPEWYEHEREMCRNLPGGEMVRRAAWWQRAWDRWDGEIPEYHAEYGEGMHAFLRDFGVNQDEVERTRADYDYLVTWAEA